MDKIQELRESTQKIYDAGHDMGYDQGLTDVIEKQEAFLSGEPKTHYDLFWDAFQQNGNRKNYRHAFGGGGWTNDILKPKYPIKPIASGTEQQGAYMFTYLGYENEIIDMTDICQKLDLSKITNFERAFEAANVKNITLDLSNIINVSYLFNGASGGSVDNVTIKMTETTKTGLNNMFWYTRSIVNLRFTEDSVIAETGLNLQRSTKLNKESIESIINALSTEKEGLTVTLSQTAVDNAFETVKGAADGSTSAEWIALAGNETTDGIRPKWNILLV